MTQDRNLEQPPPFAPPLWLLALITISGTMAMHMFVPAMPGAANALQVTPGAMQMAISIYIVGLAAGQLIYGPLSDAFGRRPLLMTGLVLYVIGGVICAFAPQLRILLVGRLVQALGGCAGLALGRAIVRDTSSRETAVRQFSLLNLMILIGPGAAPMVGGALASAAGWRSIFVLLAILGVGTLFCSWRLLAETSAPSGRLDARTLLGNYRALLGSVRFMGFALGGGCATTSVYAFLSAAPFIFVNELHQPVRNVGVLTGTMILGMAAGNSVASRLSQRLGADRLVRVGTSLSLASAAALLAIACFGNLTVAGTIALMLVFTCGCGLTSPAAMAKAISVEPQRAGSAAGLYGCIQMAVGAVCTTLAALGNDPSKTASAVMVAATAVSLVAFTAAIRRERAE